MTSNHQKEINNQLRAILTNEFIILQKNMTDLIKRMNGIKEGPLKEEIKLIEFYVDFALREDKMRSEENIFRTITVIGNIEAQLAIIDSEVSKLSSSTNSAQIINLISALKSNTKPLSSHLWQLLSQMMTLKHWSISGNSNMNIFGFSSGATLQLTFGP